MEGAEATPEGVGDGARIDHEQGRAAPRPDDRAELWRAPLPPMPLRPAHGAAHDVPRARLVALTGPFPAADPARVHMVGASGRWRTRLQQLADRRPRCLLTRPGVRQTDTRGRPSKTARN